MPLTRAVGRRLGCGLFLSAALAPAAAADPPRGGGLLAPVTPACISSPYGPRNLPDKPLASTFHHGVDLPAPEGAPVRAAAPGQIIRVQNGGPGGLEMLIQHAGFIGVYSHLGSVDRLIAVGRLTVNAGQTIGTVGRTGVTYGMHLYFGMLVDGRSVDPAPALGVAACDGAVPQRFMMRAETGPSPALRARAVREIRAITRADGKLLPTRLYLGG